MTTAIASRSSPSRAPLAELRGYALLGLCLAIAAGFVAEFWRAPDLHVGLGVNSVAAQPAVTPCQPG